MEIWKTIIGQSGEWSLNGSWVAISHCMTAVSDIRRWRHFNVAGWAEWNHLKMMYEIAVKFN